MTTLSNGKHLTLSDRIVIETGIENGDSFTEIAKRLGKSPSSISREVRRHLFLVPHYYNENSRRKTECVHFSDCQIKGVCGNTACSSICSKCRSKRCAVFCSAFETQKCSQLLKPPYVCNKCTKLRHCSHDFYFYRAKSTFQIDCIYFFIQLMKKLKHQIRIDMLFPYWCFVLVNTI